MAAGQQPLAPFAVLDATLAVERRLECREAERGALHVRQLRDVLELDALFRAQAMGLATVSQIALSLSCSEFRASRLLVEAQGLAELPGALEAVECGLLTVEQSGTVVAQLAVLDLPGRVAVWRRLQAQLVADHQAGVVRPPARLAERLRRWVVEQDRQAAEERRRRAEEHRRLDYRKRDDGLADLFAFGFRPLELQAILQRIQALSAPLGADDDRTADQRRFDALRDLLLGRHDRCPAAADGAAGGAACGCRPGELAPCGAQLQVLVTLRGALGISDEVGELVGHGPIEPDQLQALLANRPQLRAVFTDDAGVPVATSDMVLRPERGDAASVRQALLQLSRMSPDDWHPRHPDDHPPEDLLGQPPGDDPPEDFDGHPFDDDSRGAALPGRRAADRSRRGGSLRRPELACPVPAGLSGPHPAGDPGPYQVRGRLRRLVFTRAPRCEFPGCGAAAVRCDAEHDRAHPDGPSCACNVGPLCRRHHRVKQLGWIKTRTIDSAVRWTNPTGRSWTSPSQHAPPAPAVRPLPLLPINDNPWDQLSPSALDQELAHLGLLPPDDDPQRFELRAIDLDPDDVDPYPLDPWGQPRDTTWTLDLADPYGWMDPRGDKSSWTVGDVRERHLLTPAPAPVRRFPLLDADEENARRGPENDQDLPRRGLHGDGGNQDHHGVGEDHDPALPGAREAPTPAIPFHREPVAGVLGGHSAECVRVGCFRIGPPTYSRCTMLRPMQTSHRLTLIAVALAFGTFAYFSVGLGYHRLVVACYDSRHSVDQEPMVGGGPFGVMIDAFLWPVFLAAMPSDISCLPRPLGE